MYWLSSEYLKNKLPNSFEFEAQNPYPHIVIDNLLPMEVAKEISRVFPLVSSDVWTLDSPGAAPTTRDPLVEKLQCSRDEFFPSYIRNIMRVNPIVS